jgi:hypothetical protein
MKKNLSLYPSTHREAAGTVYSSDWTDVSAFHEMLLILAVTAQGTYTNETLDVTIQGKDANGNVFTLAQFTQVGNVVSSVPYVEPLKLSNFGQFVRAKIVTAGTDVDYTFSVLGFAKRYSEK